MNYTILLLMIALLYYIINLQNKAILLLIILISLYIYYEGILPNKFWKIPEPLYKEKFKFGKLDKLVSEYNKGSFENNEDLIKEIQEEINTIYFSFPSYQHDDISNYLYRLYGFM